MRIPFNENAFARHKKCTQNLLSNLIFLSSLFHFNKYFSNFFFEKEFKLCFICCFEVFEVVRKVLCCGVDRLSMGEL